METPSAPKHHELILKALSQVPIATTKQIAMLNGSLDPQKKASRLLRELEQEKLIQSKYHRREKVWYLLKKVRQLQQVTPKRFPTKVDHAIAVINLYFSMRPKYWMYEPIERFTHLGRELVWAPDCIFVYQKKVYVCEVQLTAMTGKKWEATKWRYWNLFFNDGHFKRAASSSGVVIRDHTASVLSDHHSAVGDG